MAKFEIHGHVIRFVAGVFEANSLEEAQVLAKVAFANGDCELGDEYVFIEED